MGKRWLWIPSLLAIIVLLCAFDWPPQPYEMPRTLLTVDLLGNYLGGLFKSIRSIGSVGFVICMILSTIFLIPVFFRKYILKDFLRSQTIAKAVDKKDFARAVRAADREQNRQAIINDRVAEMEISYDVRKKFRELHPRAELEERIYQRQLSYVAGWEYHDTFDREKVEGLFKAKK